MNGLSYSTLASKSCIRGSDAYLGVYISIEKIKYGIEQYFWSFMHVWTDLGAPKLNERPKPQSVILIHCVYASRHTHSFAHAWEHGRIFTLNRIRIDSEGSMDEVIVGIEEYEM